ncbi:MAG: RNA 2'-phosphotransferase [Clostridia bacterium]|nr:RNA 2'-phosphotransferase [Clostridia bacterium]
MNYNSIGRFLTAVLRHNPGILGLTLDPHGWVEVDALLAAMQIKRPDFNREALDIVVATDSKHRFAYSEDGRRIRCSQGHSLRVDVQPTLTTPPDHLWHGTAARFLPAILAEGLRPMGRIHVHLSPDRATAHAVGRRHGAPALLLVDSARMAADGFLFYLSANGVWLTDVVPPEYLTREEEQGADGERMGG